MKRRGSMILETALWIPILLLLISGVIQFGKITYTYYTLRKTVYTAASYLAQQQGTNYCDLVDDPNYAAALNFAVTGTTDGSGAPLVSGRLRHTCLLRLKTNPQPGSCRQRDC